MVRLIICITYLIHILFLIYFINLGMQIKKRREMNIVEATTIDHPYAPVMCWGIGFIDWILISVLFCIDFIKIKYFLEFIYLAFLSLLFTIIIFLYTKCRIELKDDKIIKYSIFGRKIIYYSEITEIKQTMFGYKFLSNKKILFSINSKYHNYSQIFIEKIKKNMQYKTM